MNAEDGQQLSKKRKRIPDEEDNLIYLFTILSLWIEEPAMLLAFIKKLNISLKIQQIKEPQIQLIFKELRTYLIKFKMNETIMTSWTTVFEFLKGEEYCTTLYPVQELEKFHNYLQNWWSAENNIPVASCSSQNIDQQDGNIFTSCTTAITATNPAGASSSLGSIDGVVNLDTCLSQIRSHEPIGKISQSISQHCQDKISTVQLVK